MHAFCYTCTGEKGFSTPPHDPTTPPPPPPPPRTPPPHHPNLQEDDGSLNNYCEAVLQKYNYDGYQTPAGIRDLVYDDMVLKDRRCRRRRASILARHRQHHTEHHPTQPNTTQHHRVATFPQEDYWCSDDVLNAIEERSFKEKLEQCTSNKTTMMTPSAMSFTTVAC